MKLYWFAKDIPALQCLTSPQRREVMRLVRPLVWRHWQVWLTIIAALLALFIFVTHGPRLSPRVPMLLIVGFIFGRIAKLPYHHYLNYYLNRNSEEDTLTPAERVRLKIRGNTGDPFLLSRPSRLLAPAHSPALAARSAAIEAALGNIPWHHYGTAYGSGMSIPLDLRVLMLGSHGQAMKAAHHLWCGLCHQHAYISSGAIPALPFLLETLHVADLQLQVEILDILAGFVVSHDASGRFTRRILRRLATERDFIATLANSPDETVADFAKTILASLPDHETRSDPPPLPPTKM